MNRSLRESVCAVVTSGRVFAGLVGVTLALSSSLVHAATFFGTSSDGHAVSATADFSAVGDTLTVKLTNTTTTTLDAGELFTGLDFSVSGLTPTMTSDTGILRTINADGTFSDTGAAEDLSWSLVDLGGGMWQLNFNPDAKHAIVGPPSGGDYAGANPSVRGNPGHNPFAAEMATFVLDVPGLSMAPLPSVLVKTFRFGTNLDPGDGGPGGGIEPGGGPEAPEPASIALLLLAAGMIAVRRRQA